MKSHKLLSVIVCIILSVFLSIPVSAKSSNESIEQKELDTKLVNMTAKKYADGWHTNSFGDYFYTIDDQKITGWWNIGSNTYYFDSNGLMYTGWLKAGDIYYYMKSDGTRATNTTLTIDGQRYSFDSSGKYTAPKKQTNKASVSTAVTKAKSGTTYVLNTNTYKFHYEYCSSVNQMKEKNKKYYTGDRYEVINMGYDPCKRCNP